MSSNQLLIVDDDQVFADRLGLSMERLGYNVVTSYSTHEAIDLADHQKPDYALIDLRLDDGSGLEVVKFLKETCPKCKIVMMTAYGNFQTAVSAVKAGAVDYIAKPADAQSLHNALRQSASDLPAPPEDPMSPDMVKWDHIQRIYEQCNRNVTETARKLQMHRRTLQRILRKHAPHDKRPTSSSSTSSSS